MMGDDGSLLSLSPADLKPERLKIDGKAVAICKSAGRLVAIIQAEKGKWSINWRSSTGWDVGPTIAIDNESLAAFGCAEEGSAIAIVTDHRLVEVEGARVRAVKLSQKLESTFGVGTALIDGNAIWVGFNLGEWGGGLRRIERSDGKMEIVEKNRSGELCGGPLNTGCDPVNGIVASPSKPSCVVAAIGLVHMMSHGRIVEVCDTTVRRVYFKPTDHQPPYGKPDEGEPASTIAFFGLTRVGNTVWALGTDGLYRFDGASSPQFRPLPTFENRGGYQVSFDVPGLVLLMTDVNQRRSLSGAVPIMAAR
ncbi:hypothetical protein LRS12_07725 [Sphingomonas sp. J344]|nr:hypothetical protein [Sphingomonas sp. J344]MCR5870600.1 hypothetical protein [Sphingomonas sp. J344]